MFARGHYGLYNMYCQFAPSVFYVGPGVLLGGLSHVSGGDVCVHLGGPQIGTSSVRILVRGEPLERDRDRARGGSAVGSQTASDSTRELTAAGALLSGPIKGWAGNLVNALLTRRTSSPSVCIAATP